MPTGITVITMLLPASEDTGSSGWVTTEPRRAMCLRKITRQLGAGILPTCTWSGPRGGCWRRRVCHAVPLPPLCNCVWACLCFSDDRARKNHNLWLQEAPKDGDIRSSCWCWRRQARRPNGDGARVAMSTSCWLWDAL